MNSLFRYVFPEFTLTTSHSELRLPVQVYKSAGAVCLNICLLRLYEIFNMRYNFMLAILLCNDKYAVTVFSAQ